MYFWRIEKLKAAMAARPLSEREALPYLVVFVALSTAVAYLPQPTYNFWDSAALVWSVAFAIFGTIFVYHQNGGGHGQHFLQRYLAIGWVVALRWLVILGIAAVVFYGTLATVGIATERTGWYDLLFLVMAEVVIYWRIGHHVRDLARRTTAQISVSPGT